MAGLATCGFAECGENVVLFGPIGTGKTYLSRARQGGLCQKNQNLLRTATRPRGPLARESRPAKRRAEAAAEVRGVRPARERRVAVRVAGRAVQGDAAGAFRAALREGIDRPMYTVQKEGLAPEGSAAACTLTRLWTVSSTTPSGSRWAT